MAGPAGPHSATPAELQDRIAAERSGWPFLLWRAGDEQRILLLDDDLERATVGRGDEIDVGLDDDGQVSRLHAELERIGGQWTIVDDGLSRNGSFVNGDRLGGRRRLRDGDELRFGSTSVAFRAPPAGGAPETAAATDSPALELTETQRRILIALCRPFRDGGAYATPATNQQVADEVHLSVDAVKGHLRALFTKFAVGPLPQNQKRIRLVELALRSGVISVRDLS